jgi:GT2 family glycosyltransferase
VKLAIVILNWNGKELLEKFLPSVVEHSTMENVQIVIADNASTDSSVTFITDAYPQIEIVQNLENGGFAKGYNDALQNIDADIYALLNNDVEVSENWLPPIISVFQEEEKTAIIQPKILDYKNRDQFEYAGAGGGFIDKLGYPYCRGRIFASIEKDQGQFNDTREIFWASGACFFIRSEVFHSLNGFDEDYFAHQEEIDLCWRTQNYGNCIKYIGNSTIYHLGGGTLEKAAPKKTFLNFRNSLFSLVKNLPSSKLPAIILCRLALDGVAGIKFLFELKPRHCWAIIRAHFSFYYKFFKMYGKRNQGQIQIEYYQVISIVWNYFILGKKHFIKQEE